MNIRALRDRLFWGIPLAWGALAIPVCLYHSAHMRETGGLLDALLHFVMSGGKLMAIGGFLFVAMPGVLPHLHGRPGRAAVAFAVWLATLITLLAAATHWRPALERSVDSDVARYYPTSGGAQEGAGYPDMAGFTDGWNSGAIVRRELGILAMLAAGLAIAGWLGGRPGQVAWVLAAIVLVLAGVASVKAGLIVADYDFFFAGSLVGPVLLDVTVPHVASPLTVLTLPFFVTLLWASFALHWRWGRPMGVEVPPRIEQPARPVPIHCD